MIGVAGNIAGNLASGLLQAAGGRMTRSFKGPDLERRKALEQFLATALTKAIITLSLDSEHKEHYAGIIEGFLALETAQEELTLLIDPRPSTFLDVELLRNELEASGADADWIVDFDFNRFIFTMADAFYDAAATRPEFQGILNIQLLRGTVQQLRAVAGHTGRTAFATEVTANYAGQITRQITELIQDMLKDMPK